MLVGALAVAALAGACGGTRELTSQAGPSPVVLADTSPAQFQVGVFVSMGGYDRSSRDGAMVDINFTAGGHPVRFTRNEGVACNGTALTRYVGSFEGIFRLDAIAGKPMTCVYVWGSESASITMQVPRKLVIMTPREGETVARSAGTGVTFDANSNAALTVVAIGPNAKAWTQPTGPSSTGATLDTSRVGSGSGSISMTQQLDLTGIRAPAFRSVSGRANLMTMIEVAWQ
jgi:hypothetical protein